MSEQVPYQEFEFTHDPATDFALNPEARCPCVLLLDTSYSMNGLPITELNEGLGAFKSDVETDSLASKRVEVATVTFGPVEASDGFTTIADWQPPTLVADGVTPMGEAIEKAIAMVNERKAQYRMNGVKYYRPWIILVTDGAPTDNWQRASQEVRDGESSKNFAFFAVGVASADMRILGQISVRTPLSLRGLRFRELFQWLSSSMRSVSQSVPGTEVSIPAPTGWASV